MGRAVAEALSRHGVATYVVPDGFPPEWLPATAAATAAPPPLDRAELAGFPAALTTAAFGIAETGTIVLDGGPGQGARMATLLPDLHICVLPAAALVPDVPDALERSRPAIAAGRPITMISGPSATSDIELTRVEGVHGPRRLEVIWVVSGPTNTTESPMFKA